MAMAVISDTTTSTNRSTFMPKALFSQAVGEKVHCKMRLLFFT
jgi:hypothetical protein